MSVPAPPTRRLSTCTVTAPPTRRPRSLYKLTSIEHARTSRRDSFKTYLSRSTTHGRQCGNVSWLRGNCLGEALESVGLPACDVLRAGDTQAASRSAEVKAA